MSVYMYIYICIYVYMCTNICIYVICIRLLLNASPDPRTTRSWQEAHSCVQSRWRGLQNTGLQWSLYCFSFFLEGWLQNWFWRPHSCYSSVLVCWGCGWSTWCSSMALVFLQLWTADRIRNMSSIALHQRNWSTTSWNATADWFKSWCQLSCEALGRVYACMYRLMDRKNL